VFTCLKEVFSIKKAIVCIDRDGTLINDEKFFLGKEEGWQAKVAILPGVLEGLSMINEIRNVAVYMITNQAGVAIADYPLLTFDRAHEVCRYVMNQLDAKGGRLAGYFLCPHASHAYVQKKPGVSFHEKLVHDCHCLKPGLGMVIDALQAEDASLYETDIYVIGDRLSDVQTALNINGTGILIPFASEPGEAAKVRNLEDQSRIFIAKDLVEAADFIRLRQND
jgi:histidinol-phosphate phosphatase family protein